MTVAAWENYVRLTEARIQSELEQGPFLAWESLSPADASQCRETIQSGKVYVTEMHTRNEEGRELDIPKGRIHHWLGAVLVRGAKLTDVLAWVKDCRNFEKAIPQVVESHEISRQGDTLRMFLEVKGGRVRTAYYNTEHVVEYKDYGPDRTFSRTQATRIAELEDAGTPNEREKPEGNDSGYLWRWNSYWRYLETPEGVILECESISLSRSIPVMFRWLINLLTKTVPKEALETTLRSLRDGME